MPVRRIPYPFTHFGGENNADGMTNQRIFGRAGKRQLIKLRSYQLIGWGRVKKRYGYKSYITPQITGSAPGQGCAVHRKGTTYYFVVVAGGKIKVMDKTNDQWIDITGSAVPTGGQDVLMSWGTFNDGTDQWLMGSNGVDEPFLWDGNPANAVRLLRTFDSTLEPADVAGIVGFDSFHGYPMLFSNAGLHYAGYGTLSFSANDAGIIDVGRGSQALAMHRHSKDVVFLFYDEEIYRVEFNPDSGSAWRALPVDDSEPCISRASIITKDGVTYYAGERGIHALKRAGGPSEFIGREIETFWQECNQARRFYVSKVRRGAPWNEVMWLVSWGDATTHDAVIVWNTQLKGWTIFPPAYTAGRMEFNCGASWPDANSIPRTLMIDYEGRCWEAFGHKGADSGYTDNGALVQTDFETGFLDYGWAGVTYTRKLILDIEASSEKTFTLTAEPINKTPLVKDFNVGAGGDLLDATFILDESILAEFTVTQAETKIDRDARYMKIKLSEVSADVPHVIAGFNLTHRHGGMRMVA